LAIENLKIKHLILAILNFEYGVLAKYIQPEEEKKKGCFKLSFPYFGNMEAKILNILLFHLSTPT
jgi:hypothetical protein